MKAILFTILLFAAFSARGQETRHLNYLEKALPPSVKLLPNGVIEISNTDSTPLRVELLRIENPGISAQQYAVSGQIKYEGVLGDGFLEMWSVFPPKTEGAPDGRYFSRTMAASGEMGKISGTSDWRTFQLPFDRTGSASAPKRLEINLVLPAAGTVFLEPMTLAQYPGGLGSQPGAWWSDRTAGLFGGIGGGVVGCLGSLLGILAARRKAKGFVFGTAYALIGFGCALALGGLAAVFLRQPYAVWFPLVLGALLLLTIIPSRLREMRRSYEDHELRRMTALDVGHA